MGRLPWGTKDSTMESQESLEEGGRRVRVRGVMRAAEGPKPGNEAAQEAKRHSLSPLEPAEECNHAYSLTSIP